jgi:chemotaxis protein histidine kinase CheA
MTRVRPSDLSPTQKLRFVARTAETLGEYDIALQVSRAVRAVEAAANTEVVLDSWPEFESWFLKNRSQGLEFVFADKYGESAAETQAIKQLLEGYDLLERQLNELYQTLRGDAATAAPVEEPVAEEPAEEAPTEESEAEATEEPTEESAPEEEAILEEAAPSEQEAGESEEEQPSEEEAAAEEALEPSREASAKPPMTPEAKMVGRIQKLMTRARLNVASVAFRGNGTYRVTCASADEGVKAEQFLASTGWKHERTDHPTGRVMFDVTPRDV